VKLLPKIRVEGRGTFEVDAGTKLILAMKDHGVDVLHRCGGNIRCTTCRVQVIEGDAGEMDESERAKLIEKGHSPEEVRLACQIRVSGDMVVRPVMTLASSGLPDPGPRPQE